MNLKQLQELSINDQKLHYLDRKKIRYLFFWGHMVPRNGKITRACLSQWYECKFTIDNTDYQTAEHWMMAEKARIFNDIESLNKILESSGPRKAKALGRKVNNFNNDIWSDKAFDIVVKGNIAKFSQNDFLADFLLGTNNHILVEASPYDTIWGIGLKSDDKRAKDPQKWKGQNLLGFALMNVRDYLRKERTK